jgi:hypothetical protein
MYSELLFSLAELTTLPLSKAFLTLFTAFGLQSIGSDISMATPLSFGFQLHGIPYSILFTFRLCVALELK